MLRKKWEEVKDKINTSHTIIIEYQNGMSKGRINRKATYNPITLDHPCRYGDHIVVEGCFGKDFYNYKHIRKISFISGANCH